MSKKLTPLQALEKLVDRLAIKKYDENGNLIYWQSTTDNEYSIIKTALKDYEHSQQQRELYFKQAKELKECYKNELKNTAYYNNLALKYKKALEIIKEKKWLVEDILNAFIEDKEKCDLLKEVLG